MYVVCPVLLCIKLQTEITLSKIEAEYITLSQAMCNVISCMEMMKEISFIFNIHIPQSEVFCKLFEDNKSCVAVA